MRIQFQKIGYVFSLCLLILATACQGGLPALYIADTAVDAHTTIPTTAQRPKIEQALWSMIQDDASATYSVVVQQMDAQPFVQLHATRLGGTVTKDLPIINSFATELSGNAIVTLAGHSGVKFIQLQQVMQNISEFDYQMVLNEGRQLLLTGQTYSDPDLRLLNEILNVNAVGASGAVFGTDFPTFRSLGR